MDIKVSLFASAVRPKLWPALFKSLEGTSVELEVVFSGCPDIMKGGFTYEPCQSLFKLIPTKNIKPAQNYSIALNSCIGETVVWFCDDAEAQNDVIGKAYNYWKSQNNEKLILSIQTKESGYNLPVGQLFDMRIHRFFGGYNHTPLMAPLGMMSRDYLNKLGGIDRRYVAGQYENDIVMRAYADGGKVEIFGGQDCYIEIDHLGKSYLTGESKTEADFLNRPFAKGYPQDRMVLESSWVIPGTQHGVTFTRNDTFEPFEDKDILTISQSNKGIWV